VSVQIGDRVEIERLRSTRGRILKRREREAVVERIRGRVVWAGPRFATVELECGYRESFGYEELRRVGKAS